MIQEGKVDIDTMVEECEACRRDAKQCFPDLSPEPFKQKCASALCTF